MIYTTELLIASNALALVLGIIIGRWSQRTRHRLGEWQANREVDYVSKAKRRELRSDDPGRMPFDTE